MTATAPAALPVLVGGERRGSASDEVLHVVDPWTGEPVSSVPAGCAADVDAAVAAARAARAGWARTPATERAGAVRAAAAAVRRHADELAMLNVRESGKLLADARGGVEAGAAAMETYAELGPLHRGRSLHGGWDATDLMVREPYGVAAVLTPWNDPVAIAAQDLAACLVTGNTVVFKPSERTPATGARLAELLAAELPAGVLSVVHGDARAAAPLVEHPDLDLVVFVGSAAVGWQVAAATARTGAKPVLELGGKDPLVVDAGLDPVWAARQAALGAFANAGQICTSVERVYVHEAVADAFLDALVAEAAARAVGDPRAAATRLGPLVDARMRDAVHAQVQAALTGSARLLIGGAPVGTAGYPATVLAGCDPDSPVMAEETFGPVAPVAVVADFAAGLAAANRSAYGLSAVVLTTDMRHAQQAWRELRVGTVKVNAVFGGAPGGAAEPRGASGRGFGYGPELLDEVTTVKAVHLAAPPD